MTSRPPKRATISDVAARAGVSVAAVSKVLHDAYGVSDVMRLRVNRAIAELGYRPNVAARALRGATFTIGLEVPDLGNPFVAQVGAAIRSRLAERSYQLILAPADPGPMMGLTAIQALVDRQVDGVIAISPRVDQGVLEGIGERTPFLMLGRHDISSVYDTIAGDDEAGAQAAVMHLLELGHRDIAHLTITDADARDRDEHSLRLRRFLEVMADAGVDAPLVLRAEEGEENARLAIEHAIDSGASMTAVFAAHDAFALGALRARSSRATALSVVGYDDVPIAGHPAIGLTTVGQSGTEMGMRAADLLLERIAGRGESRFELIAPRLQIRTSSRSLTL